MSYLSWKGVNFTKIIRINTRIWHKYSVCLPAPSFCNNTHAGCCPTHIPNPQPHWTSHQTPTDPNYMRDQRIYCWGSSNKTKREGLEIEISCSYHFLKLSDLQLWELERTPYNPVSQMKHIPLKQSLQHIVLKSKQNEVQVGVSMLWLQLLEFYYQSFVTENSHASAEVKLSRVFLSSAQVLDF